MNDFESRMTEMMRARSTDVDGTVVPAHQIVRRARRRRTMSLSVAVAGLVALVFSGAALSTMSDRPPREVAAPGDPSPGNTPYDGHPGEFDTTDDPSTDKIEIATGEHRGLVWTLSMYRDASRPDNPGPKEMWCDDFEWDGGGGGCPINLSKDVYLSIGRQGGDGNSEDSLTGELDKRVARVEVRLDGYAPFEVPVIPGPEIEPAEEDPDVNFMVAFVPGGSTGEIAVFDADDNELQTQPIIDFASFEDIGPEGDGVPNIDPDDRCIAERITIRGTDGPDTLRGTEKNDVIAGLGGDDTILGLEGHDVLCGGAGDDLIEGSVGHDELAGGPGDDGLDGGEDSDWLSFWDATAGVDVDLAAGTSTGQGSDRIAGFEILWGTEYDDRIAGDDGDDQIQTSGGDDVLDGRGGDDILYGGKGDDEYVGGDGEDLVSYVEAPQGVEVDLAAGTATGEGNDSLRAIETLDGSRFPDTISGGDADETLIGREGDDVLSGGEGDDVLWGELPRMTAESYREGGYLIEDADDTLDGGPGNDELHGGPGNNTCTNGEQVEDC